MRHFVYRWFSIGAYEREEKWLNEMSSKGMQLVYTNGFRYVFEEGTPGEYVYRLELLDHLPYSAESIAYIRFLEEAGIEHVASFMRWVYLRKKASDGPFDIYSDIDSRMKHNRRIIGFANVPTVLLLLSALIHLRSACAVWIRGGTLTEEQLFASVGAAVIMLGAAVFLQIVVIPIRKSQRTLKKQKSISE